MILLIILTCLVMNIKNIYAYTVFIVSFDFPYLT
jgi:hypothetical protein